MRSEGEEWNVVAGKRKNGYVTNAIYCVNLLVVLKGTLQNFLGFCPTKTQQKAFTWDGEEIALVSPE